MDLDRVRPDEGEASTASVAYSGADIEDVTEEVRSERARSPVAIVDAFGVPEVEAEAAEEPSDPVCWHEARHIASILDGEKVRKLWSAYQFPESMSYRVPGPNEIGRAHV